MKLSLQVTTAKTKLNRHFWPRASQDLRPSYRTQLKMRRRLCWCRRLNQDVQLLFGLCQTEQRAAERSLQSHRRCNRMATSSEDMRTQGRGSTRSTVPDPCPKLRRWTADVGGHLAAVKRWSLLSASWSEVRLSELQHSAVLLSGGK